MTTNEERLLMQILDELKGLRGDLNIILGDVNAIRNGEYDPPAGADGGRRTSDNVS
ncbi:hypothetical protein PWY87_34120 [Kribbella solani]|uniref:hypothetical protein n=1 Tax=Kribbella solani TaxID=236067 RepID=UPI0029A9694E|nr:hypothetical protein [Kribbella solani]MDX3006754.1 hypothetical protein [Kribbella solani]